MVAGSSWAMGFSQVAARPAPSMSRVADQRREAAAVVELEPTRHG
jgi:hypothetical protein